MAKAERARLLQLEEATKLKEKRLKEKKAYDEYIEKRKIEKQKEEEEKRQKEKAESKLKEETERKLKEEAEQEEINKSRNDHVHSQKAITSFDNDDCGHDNNYSFVIFVTTSSLKMHHNSPSFTIWSYDIMMDDLNAVKRPKSCYNSSSFEKGETQKGKEYVSYLDHLRIALIDIIPYGNHNGDKVTSSHETHHQPLALCTDIKIVERKKEPTCIQDSSIKAITVKILLGLENGDVLEYSFDMSLTVGLSNLFWITHL